MIYILDDDNLEVKPCPFCGREPVIQQDIRYPRPACNPVKSWEVVCNTLGCVIYRADNMYFKSPEEAVEKWNERKG